MRCPIYPIPLLWADWSQIPHNPALGSRESSSWYPPSSQKGEDPWLNLGTWWWRLHLSRRRSLGRWMLQQGDEKRWTSWAYWRKKPWLLWTQRWVWERTVKKINQPKHTQVTNLCSCSSYCITHGWQHLFFPFL